MQRQGRPKANFSGTISDHRVAWIQTYAGQVVLMMYPEGTADTDFIKGEDGPNLKVIFSKGSRFISMTLTSLTTEELTGIKELMDLAFDMAIPIVEQRDKAAQDAFEAGNDSVVRIYRQVPRLVVRQGAIEANSVSLRQRHEDAAPGPGGDGPVGGGLRGDGDELADGEPSAHGAEDDESPTD